MVSFCVFGLGALNAEGVLIVGIRFLCEGIRFLGKFLSC